MTKWLAFWRAPRDRSLRRQLFWRFLFVFLVVTSLGSASLLVGYRAVIQNSQREEADATAAHVLKVYRGEDDERARDADEMRAQIDFMRIFAERAGASANDSWLRLRAFFGAMEGKVGRFPSGLVLGADGVPVFNFGPEGPPLARWLQSAQGIQRWYYGAERQMAYTVLRVPLWLGAQGSGGLVLARPMDNGLMRELAPVNSHLALVIDGRVVASSLGAQGLAAAPDGGFSGRLERDGQAIEQRVLNIFDDAPNAPRLVLQQNVDNPLSAGVVLAAGVALMALLGGVLWLVIGRWSQQLAQRVAELSKATSLFAAEQQMGASLRMALENAAAKPDEIAGVAQSCRDLMQNVLVHEDERAAYVESLDKLNQQLEGRVEERTAELTRTVDTLSKMQKELVEAEKLASLGAMVAGISHELNTPIGNAVTVSSTLKDRVEDFKTQVAGGTLKRSAMSEFLESIGQMTDLISRSVHRSAKLVASFKQVAIDRQSERRRTFDLQELVRDIVNSLKPGIRPRAIDIVEDVPASVMCNSFPGPVGQILTNLIQNAVIHGYARRETGSVQVRAEVQGPQVVLTVTDEGEGMTEHVLKHAFDPFFTTRLGKGGSGLGLSISHRLATAVLGGSLSATSTPGRGSSFRLSFPLEAPMPLPDVATAA